MSSTQEENPTVSVKEARKGGEEETLQARPTSAMSFKALVPAVIIISFLSSAISIASYDFFIAQKIVTVNIQKYLEEQRGQYAAGKLTAEDVTKNLDGLINAMKNAPKNKVIILEDVVANSSEKFEPK